MRLLSAYLTIIATVVCCLLVACGDDDSPTSPGPSQSTFWRTYDLGEFEYFASLTEGSAGTIIVGGHADIEIIDSSGPTPVSDTGHQAIVVKCRPNGDTLWSASLGVSSAIETVTSITPDLSGGYMAVVSQSFSGGPGSNFMLLPVAGDGVLGTGDWVNEDQYDDVDDIRKGSDESFILAGRRNNPGTRAVAYVAKYTQSANMLWYNTYADASTNLRSQRVMELPDNTLLAAGMFNPADGSGHDLHVLRLSATGDSLYGVVVPFQGDGDVEVKDIAATSDGGYKILLYQEHDPYACTVVWMDNQGTVTLIQQSFRNTGFYIYDGEFTPDGGAILCGVLGEWDEVNSGLLVKLDASGLIVWEREFEDPDASIRFEAVIDYSGGGYIVTGNRKRLLDDSYESLLIHTDENGRVPEAP